MPPTYRLIYFNGRGRAEISRLLFAAAAVPYQDVRIEAKEWPTVKPTTMFGHLPILEIDGKPLSQGSSIIRFLANEFNMAGENNFEKAQADMILEILTEVFLKLPLFEKDEVKKSSMSETVFNKFIFPALDKIREIHLEKRTAFLLSNKMTYADLSLQDFVNNFENYKPGCMANYESLNKIVNLVEGQSKIKDWLHQRPNTKF